MSWENPFQDIVAGDLPASLDDVISLVNQTAIRFLKCQWEEDLVWWVLVLYKPLILFPRKNQCRLKDLSLPMQNVNKAGGATYAYTVKTRDTSWETVQYHWDTPVPKGCRKGDPRQSSVLSEDHHTRHSDFFWILLHSSSFWILDLLVNSIIWPWSLLSIASVNSKFLLEIILLHHSSFDPASRGSSRGTNLFLCILEVHQLSLSGST